MIETALKAPVNRNANCQPTRRAIQGTASGAIVAPALVPELNMPVARARSFLGNHSATVLIAAGKLPDSPKPRAKRTTPKPSTLRTKGCAVAARLHIPLAGEYPVRGPTPCDKLPINGS